MIQGGDITKGDGTGGASIYGGEFADENLGWREIDAAGLVCMANRGPATNSSQFFITLEPCSHLNNKHTVFGRVVSGEETLSQMAKVDVDKNDRPIEPVLIARCGELERKSKPAVSVASTHTSDDRGRQRPAHSRSRSQTPPRRMMGKMLNKRRTSDQVVDEGLRGRPKRRSESGSRSVSEAIDSDSGSPTHKHKRKRSKSPSRGAEVREEKSGSQSPRSRRRRRSLPNQYHGDRYERDGLRNGVDGGRDRDRDGEKDRGQKYAGHDRRRDEYHSGSRRREQYQRNAPRAGRLDDGRLGGDPYADSNSSEGGIVFKGRGSMKYREPDRRW